MNTGPRHPNLGPLTWNADAGWWEGERAGPDGPLRFHLVRPEGGADLLARFMALEAGLRGEIARRALAAADGWTFEAPEDGGPPVPPTPASLARRLRLGELGVDASGTLSALYDDPDPFTDHTIFVILGPDLEVREVEVAG